LAREITAREGKKAEVNIAQTKEVLRIALDILSRASIVRVWLLLRKHRSN